MKKHICFLAVLLALFFTPKGMANPVFPTTGEEWNCQLPAPSGFQITNAGTTYLSTAWNAVPGATGYKIDVFLASNGNYLFTQQFTGTSGDVTGLAPGTTYNLSIKSVCSDGTNGPNSATLTGTTLIIEIVAQGSNATNNQLNDLVAGCYGIDLSGSCQYWLLFRKYEAPLSFATFQIKALLPNKPSFSRANYTVNLLHFNHLDQTPIGQPLTASYVKLINKEIPSNPEVARFEMSANEMCVEFQGNYGSEYFVKVIEDCSGQGGVSGPGGGRGLVVAHQSDTKNAEAWEGDKQIPATEVFPNPFDDELFLLLPETDTPDSPPVSVSIVSAQGTLYSTFKTTETQVVLPTQAYPGGVYWLRIDFGTHSEIRKLVKY